MEIRVPDILQDENRKALKEIINKTTQGHWLAGCFVREDSKCQCKSICAESICGSICQMSVDNGLEVGDGGNDSPPLEEARANASFIQNFDPVNAKEILDYIEELEKQNTYLRQQTYQPSS